MQRQGRICLADIDARAIPQGETPAPHEIPRMGSSGGRGGWMMECTTVIIAILHPKAFCAIWQMGLRFGTSDLPATSRLAKASILAISISSLIVSPSKLPAPPQCECVPKLAGLDPPPNGGLSDLVPGTRSSASLLCTTMGTFLSSRNGDPAPSSMTPQQRFTLAG